MRHGHGAQAASMSIFRPAAKAFQHAQAPERLQFGLFARPKCALLRIHLNVMFRTIAVVLVLVLAWLVSAIWPVYALYDLAKAAQASDVAGISERVDFPSLRRSLTSQVVTAYIRVTGSKINPNSFAASLASSVADPIVERLITPERLAELLHSGWPGAVVPDAAPGGLYGLQPDALGNAWSIFMNSHFGIGTFDTSFPPDRPLAEQFRIHLSLSGSGWKLSSLGLPDQITDALVKRLVSDQGKLSVR